MKDDLRSSIYRVAVRSNACPDRFRGRRYTLSTVRIFKRRSQDSENLLPYMLDGSCRAKNRLSISSSLSLWLMLEPTIRETPLREKYDTTHAICISFQCHLHVFRISTKQEFRSKPAHYRSSWIVHGPGKFGDIVSTPRRGSLSS